LRKRQRSEFEKEFARWQDWSRQKMHVVIGAPCAGRPASNEIGVAAPDRR
jgi:hypothetical protein